MPPLLIAILGFFLALGSAYGFVRLRDLPNRYDVSRTGRIMLVQDDSLLARLYVIGKSVGMVFCIFMFVIGTLAFIIGFSVVIIQLIQN